MQKDKKQQAAMNELITNIINNKPLEEILYNLSYFLDDINGDYYYVYKDGKKYAYYDKKGEEVEDAQHIEESDTLREIRKYNKRYLNTDKNDFYLGIPVFHKNKFLGAILIKDSQVIKSDSRMSFVINYLILIFQHSALTKIEKLHTIKDFVTNLYNKRHFQFQLELEEEKRRRYPDPIDLTLLVIEMDNFHDLVNKYDYHTAEKAFIHLSEAALKQSRKNDMPARIEENRIGILLPYTKEIGGEKLSGRISNSTSKPITINKNKISISLNVSYSTMKYEDTKEELVRRTLSYL